MSKNPQENPVLYVAMAAIALIILGAMFRLDAFFRSAYELPQLSEGIDLLAIYSEPPIVREPYLIPNIEISMCARERGYSEKMIFAERVARGIVSDDGRLSGVANGVLYTLSDPEGDEHQYLLVWGPDEGYNQWSDYLLNGPDFEHPRFAQLPDVLKDSKKLLLEPWIHYKNARTTSFPDGKWFKVGMDVRCAEEGLNDVAWDEYGNPGFVYGFFHLDIRDSGGGTWGIIQ